MNRVLCIDCGEKLLQALKPYGAARWEGAGSERQEGAAVIVADFSQGEAEIMRKKMLGCARDGDAVVGLLGENASAPAGLQLDAEARDAAGVARSVEHLLKVLSSEEEIQKRQALRERLQGCSAEAGFCDLLEKLLTDQMKLHNHLRQEIERKSSELEAIIDSNPDPFAVLDASGRILRSNDCFRKLVGSPGVSIAPMKPGTAGLCPARPGVSLEGKFLRDFLIRYPDDEAGPEAVYARKGELRDHEAFLRAADGDPIPVAVNVSSFGGLNGKCAGSVWSMRDLRAFKKLQEEALQTHKMTAIGHLAGGVAHDFNNLLTVIRGNGEICLYDLKEESPMKEAIKDICKTAELAGRLTEQLLALGRKQMIRPEFINVADILGELLPTLRRTLPETIEIKTQLPEGRPVIRADSGQIKQIILNLAINARDAMPQGGKLTLSVAARADGARREIILEVKDTGEGMDEETKRRVFEPYYTTKEQGRGTGLGLSTVYGIVNQHGGSISVESAPGRGACFKIAFPEAADAPARESLKTAGADSPTPRPAKRVLLVEDEEDVRRMAHRVLERFGYRVTSTVRPMEAEALLTRDPDAFDILVTDVIMPGINGMELVERIRRVRPDIKIVYTSGYAENFLHKHGVQLTDDEFLPKPYSPFELIKKVQEV